jgi:S-adenosylmethionine uptake transporter
MRAGPLYMMLAGLMFTLMTAAVKVARQDMSALEIMWWRGAVGVPLSFAFIHCAGIGLRLRGQRVFAVRALLGFVAMTSFYAAARGLALTDLSLIHKLQPILVAIVAPLALGRSERPGWRDGVILGLGLGGCAILLAPDLQVGSIYGLWAVLGALFSGGAHVAVRALGSTDDPRTVVFWFMVSAVVLATIALVVTGGPALPWPEPHLVPWLVAVGVTATGGQLLLTVAYKHDRAPVVAAAAYTSPLFALAIDLLGFSFFPEAHVWIGGAIILGAGVALLRGSLVSPARPTKSNEPMSPWKGDIVEKQ